jgi:hypothetical protein
MIFSTNATTSLSKGEPTSIRPLSEAEVDAVNGGSLIDPELASWSLSKLFQGGKDLWDWLTDLF